MSNNNDLTLEEKAISNVAKEINEIPADAFLHSNYIPYSYYVIRNRALVSADGLKPVNRRILYTMFTEKITPSAKPVKAMTIAGDTMGKFHPHGDSSISDALARLAQKFNMRVPLIEPHGVVGYNTGDKAAAPRYWEARLTKAAMELLKELDDHALPMSKNYDETRDEPAILPVRFPSVLVNGTSGISVGYASNIFPHNPTEVMDVAIEMVKKDGNMTIADILKIMPGPDFPTGGEIVGADNLEEMYTKGEGKFTVRGRYEVKPLSRGRSEIIFYELPFQVSADDIIKKIKDTKNKKNKLLEISQAKDLSDRHHGLRLSITLKSGTNVDLAIEEIFKHTQAATSFSLNNVILDHGSPDKFNLLEVFEQFLELRRTAITNATNFKIEKISKDIDYNDGLVKVLVDIDKVLDIIKNSETQDDARQALIKTFKLNEDQANYILSMQLRRLTRSDREALIKKNEELKKEREHLQLILSDPEVFKEELIGQLKETKDIISDPRRTVINNKTEEELKAEKEDNKLQAKALKGNATYNLIYLQDNSVIKVLSLEDYPTLNKRNIPIKSVTTAKTGNQMFALYANGKGINFPDTYIPFNTKINLKDIGVGDGVIAVGCEAGAKDVGMLGMTRQGKVFVVSSKLPANSLSEFDVVSLADNDSIVFAEWIDKKKQKMDIISVSNDSLVARFPVSKIRPANFGIQPIKGMDTSDNFVIGASLVSDKSEGYIFTASQNAMKVTSLNEIASKNRGIRGMAIQRTKEPLVMMYASDNNMNITDIMGNPMMLPEPTKRALVGIKFPIMGLIIGDQNIAE